MSREEVKRLAMIQRLIHRQITTREAAELLDLSLRQVYRLKARVLQEGAEGIVHKPGEKTGTCLIGGTTAGDRWFVPKPSIPRVQRSSFAELLSEHEGIHVYPSTVRRILRSAGIRPARKRRPPKAHRPRPRKPQAGLLVQIDASPHAWFEDRGAPCALLKAVDDATGQILAARFEPTEDLAGYFRLLQKVIESHGVPVAIYSVRHRIFQSPNEALTVEQELAGLSPQKRSLDGPWRSWELPIPKPTLLRPKDASNEVSGQHRTAGSLSSVCEMPTPLTKEMPFCQS